MFRLKIINNLVRFRTGLFRIEPTNYCSRVSTQMRPKIETLSNQDETEANFLIRIKNDPNIFGGPPEPPIIDEGDIQEDKFHEEKPAKRLRTKQYADIIKAYISEKKIKEALDVLEIRMLKEDRVKPENYIYNLLLGACGTVGYTKKAFSLFNNMKKRGLQPTGGTYTALFNACANSPWPADGLSRAHHLRNLMIEKLYEPNDTNYNAMIKAFGRCGDLGTAFSLVDEMVAKKMPTRDDTMNFLLQACINDKEAGFRHALLIWRKMMTKRIRPSVYTFNLMLRSIRDCGFGDLEAMQDVLDTILMQNPAISGGEVDNKLLLGAGATGNGALVVQAGASADLAVSGSDELNYMPNLMSRAPHLGNIVSMAEIKRPEDRLLLVGAAKGFLETMRQFECAPDIRTFTLMLDVLPGSLAAEKDLLNAMKQAKVKPDLDFLNMLIKKRSMRADYKSARDVLALIEERGFRPDLITYGVLALGCKSKQEAQGLIQEMKDHSYRLNTQILGAMLKQACYHKNFPYVLEIMELSKREDIPPNMAFLEHLARFKSYCKKISNDRGNQLASQDGFQIGYKNFKMRYKTWLQEINADESETAHPWQQFRQTTETDTKHVGKSSVTKFKPRHTSKFRVKTSTKHQSNK